VSIDIDGDRLAKGVADVDGAGSAKSGCVDELYSAVSTTKPEP